MKSLLILLTGRRVWLSCVLLITLLTACSTKAQSPRDEQTTTPEQSIENISVNDYSKIQVALDQMNDRLNQTAPTTPAHIKTKESKGSQDTGDGPSTQMKDPVMGTATNKGMGMKADMQMDKSMSAMQKDKMKKGKCMGMMCQMGMKNMSMMGQPPSDQGSKIANTELTLPGYPGVPHLYHIGEKEFFLDLSAQLGLAQDQIDQLKVVQSRWLNRQTSMLTERDSYEQRLWELTAKGAPDYDAIQETVESIESTNSELRLAFIKQVGTAITILTADQISELTDNTL